MGFLQAECNIYFRIIDMFFYTISSKRLSTLIIILFSLTATVFAQDRGFSFQGYARDAEGAALSGEEVQVKFSIFMQGQEASPDYTEEHQVNTDAYGVFAATVGSKQPTVFEKLPFSVKDYWLKVETKFAGGDWVEINKTELLSVPYAKAAENGVPPGTILPFAGTISTVPPGYLPCDGSSYSTSDYPNLYSAIGNGWGTDGSKFRVPDLRGQFLRGVAQGQGADPDRGGRTAKYSGGNTGDNVGTYQGDEFESHKHGASSSTAGAHNHTSKEFTGWAEAGGDYWNDIVTRKNSKNSNTSTAGDHSHTITINNTGGQETRPTNAAVYYIIKY